VALTVQFPEVIQVLTKFSTNSFFALMSERIGSGRLWTSVCGELRAYGVFRKEHGGPVGNDE